MKIINGIYKPDAGEIFIDEEPVKIKDPIKARSLGIAMIAQELNYVPEVSVEALCPQNIYFFEQQLNLFLRDGGSWFVHYDDGGIV